MSRSSLHASATIGLALIASAGLACSSAAQTVAPFYAANYSAVNLGSVPGVPASYGGINFLPGDNNVLLIGGGANGGSAAIYRINVVRDAQNNITGFSGNATVYSTAAFIDGGLTRGPLNVLMYTTYSNNTLGQIKPGSSAPDKIIQLTPLGISSSTGTCFYVPGGFPGAGTLKIASYNAGTWYSCGLSGDGNGTFDIVSVSPPILIGGGPEGIVYVPTSSPLFGTPSILVSEYGSGSVAAYEINASGDPIVASRKNFITGLSGVEGAVLDPVTGQFLFSTFGGGNSVIVVRGFLPAAQCYANCDQSTEVPVLTAGDFSCFLSRFRDASSLAPSAQITSYANCDASTVPPVLNAGDFSCFLARFRVGCP